MTAGPAPALRIYTDASYAGAGRGQIGAWGAVLVWGQDDTTTHSAAFRSPCQNSTTAELNAIANGLAVALRSGRLVAGQSIHVYSDCKTMIDILSNRRTIKPRVLAKIRTGLTEIDRLSALMMRQVITFHWVKGHQPNETICAHGMFNRAADHAAVKANPNVKSKSQKNNEKRAARKASRARAHEARALESVHGA